MLVSEVRYAGTGTDPHAAEGARQARQDGLREAPDAFGHGKGGIEPPGPDAAQPLSQAQETGWRSTPEGKAPIGDLVSQIDLTRRGAVPGCRWPVADPLGSWCQEHREAVWP